MYKWRKMNSAERNEILRLRKQHSRPWYSPPYWDSEGSLCYIVSAACYEHNHIVGKYAKIIRPKSLRGVCCQIIITSWPEQIR